MSLLTISLLLLAASFSAFINHHFLRLPPAIGIMSVSLGISLILIGISETGLINLTGPANLIRELDFDSLLLHGMLSFLLFAGALHINFEDLHLEKVVIAVLATLGVVLACVLTGSLYWVFAGWIGIDMPFMLALVFGALISPTDPIAVLGILRKAGVPKNLETIISGEALFNDGIGVVVFLTISALAFNGDASVISVASTLFREVSGGTILGLTLGWVTYRMLKTVDSYAVEVLLTLTLAAGSYSLAEVLHVSAPICTVVAGLIVGNQGRMFAMSETTRRHLDMFWELTDEFLNAVLFMLIGFEIIALSIKSYYVVAGLASIIAVLAGRWLSVWIPITFMSKWRNFAPGTVKILTWGGLRGGISVALALSLPLIEHHDLLVVSTYITVLFSILIQGTSLTRLKLKDA